MIQLGTAASAQAELAASAHELRKQARPSFRVASIPGARGLGSSKGRVGGLNVLFADGRFVYLVGVGWNNAKNRPTRAQLIAAATHLYRRVHGHPAA